MGPEEPPDYVVAADHTSTCFRWQELVGQGAGEEQAAEAVRRAREAAFAQEEG
jgi:hypothetical protein